MCCLSELMLPNTKNSPALCPQRAVHQMVAHFVLFKFSVPEEAIATRIATMHRTTVPETTIYEDRNTMFGKYEIWIAEKMDVATPSNKAVLTEQRCHRQLSGLVAVPAHARHNLRTLCFCKDVSHLR